MRQKRHLETARAAREAKWLCKNQENEEAEDESNWDNLVLQFVQSIPEDFIDELALLTVIVEDLPKIVIMDDFSKEVVVGDLSDEVVVGDLSKEVAMEDLPKEIVLEDLSEKL
ncbi:hypothetical protein HK096_001514, partial [Nowakowskiella sp. JEL0078]